MFDTSRDRAPATAEPTPHTVPMTATADALDERKLAEEDAWARKVLLAARLVSATSWCSRRATRRLRGRPAMNNEIPTAPAKPLKLGFCGFFYFGRRHEGDTPPCTRMGLEKETSPHNNKSNNNIYINELEGCCVAGWGIV